MKPTTLLLACALGCALAAEAAGPLHVHGGDRRAPGEAKLRKLKQEGLISSAVVHEGDDCSHGDSPTFNDQYIRAEAVVRATVTGVRYLYKEGGPFRTEYALSVQESFKGGLAGEVKVLSQYGPNTRDHSRWKTGHRFLRLAKGDAGFFFLDRGALEALAADRPDRSGAFAGSWMLLGDVRGVYLTKGDEFDPDFLAAAGKAEKRLKAAESRRAMQRMREILDEKEGGSHAE